MPAAAGVDQRLRRCEQRHVLALEIRADAVDRLDDPGE
jgi:hypothetical protein